MLIGGWKFIPPIHEHMLTTAFDPYQNKGRMCLYAHSARREGRVGMKYMGDYYSRQTTNDLKVLRSKKYNRVSKLRKEASTYLNMQELKKLIEQIRWIDSELACRREQMGFGL